MQSSTNNLLSLANPIFLFVVNLCAQGGTNLDIAREELMHLLHNLNVEALNASVDSHSLQQLKYALVAFIDEIVLSSHWPGRLNWMGRPLQIHYFGNQCAGEQFFERLAQLRQNPQQSICLLEVYYLCLKLGFEGGYRLRNPELLHGLLVSLERQIFAIRGTPNQRFALHLIAADQNVSVRRLNKKFNFWLLFSCALMIAIFFTSYLMVHVQAQKTASIITSIVGSLMD